MNRQIGILTYYWNNFNFGGMLQSFALPRALAKLGYDARQISYDVRAVPRRAESGGTETVKRGLIALFNRANRPLVCSAVAERDLAFSEFQKTRIPHTEEIYSRLTIPRALARFDAFLCGSDQIWNAGLTRDASYFLDFVPVPKPKIAYAPSIGRTCLSPRERQVFRARLAGFSALSVRERRAKAVLEELLPGRTVHHVLDPTLLLTRADWDAVCPARSIEGGYILCYLLGVSLAQRRLVTRLSRRTGLPVVTFPHILHRFRPCDVGFGDIRSTRDGPDGFLSLIRNADCVVTDSFHACVFSYLFRKPFYVFPRHRDGAQSSMNSRIYDLMELFGTQSRILRDSRDEEKIDLAAPVDYSAADRNVAQLRLASLQYLQNALAESGDERHD